ncbi:MAG: hypothetical protein M3R02_10450 [Chloroflexota bacterium]|nr:hypothetical protein [Chloroflexota bacterium]
MPSVAGSTVARLLARRRLMVSGACGCRTGRRAQRQDNRPDPRQASARTPPAAQEVAPHPAVDALLESQRQEIAYLREQLAERSRELAAERERFDVLHREALARIPALAAGQDAPQSSPAARHATAAAEATGDASAPWWKFWERWG